MRRAVKNGLDLSSLCMRPCLSLIITMISSDAQDTAPFFGFIGAASALVFSCEGPMQTLFLQAASISAL